MKKYASHFLASSKFYTARTNRGEVLNLQINLTSKLIPQIKQDTLSAGLKRINASVGKH